MSLSNPQRAQIADLLKERIRRKLSNYSPESYNMPFHVRLLGQDRMALFSFIQSVNTMLGTSVFEQVAAVIAAPHFKSASNQYKNFNICFTMTALVLTQELEGSLPVLAGAAQRSQIATPCWRRARNDRLVSSRAPPVIAKERSD